jgi:hypothetical protein
VLRIFRNVGSLLLASYSFIVDNTTAVAKFSSGIDRANDNTQGNIVWRILLVIIASVVFGRIVYTWKLLTQPPVANRLFVLYDEYSLNKRLYDLEGEPGSSISVVFGYGLEDVLSPT